MAAFEYAYSDYFSACKVQAQTVGEIMEGLEKQGELSPRTLLDASREANSPLHEYFDWDDTTAAEKWRLEQARVLIANVRIIRSDDKQEREALKDRCFVPATGQKGVYVHMDTALHKDEYRKRLLEQARRDSEIYIAKYRRIEELAMVVQEMENFLNVG